MAVGTADPGAIDLNEAFRQAMEQDPKPRSVASDPPDVDREAPFGRDDDGQPKAPYGLNKDGSIRRAAGGRGAADARARVGVVIPPDKTKGDGKKGGKGKAEPDHNADYSGPLMEACQAIWLGLTGLSMVGPGIPVVGKFLNGDKIGAEAAIFAEQTPAICRSLQIAAKHNAGAARFCAKLASGEVTWVAMAGFSIMPFFVQTSAVLRGDKALAEMDETGTVTLKALNEKNQADMKLFMESTMAQMQVLAEAEAAAASAAETPQE